MERSYSDTFRQILRRVRSNKNSTLYAGISAKFCDEREQRVWEIFREFQTEDVRMWNGDIDVYKVNDRLEDARAFKLLEELNELLDDLGWEVL